MRSRIGWGVGYFLVAVIGALAAMGTGVLLRGPEATASEVRTQQEAAPVAERTVALAPGFNLVGWTGDESIGAVEATAAIPGATAIFGFNALTQ